LPRKTKGFSEHAAEDPSGVENGCQETIESAPGERNPAAKGRSTSSDAASRATDTTNRMVRRMHKQAERGTFEEWCKAVSPGKRARAIFWKEYENCYFWDKRDTCPRCRGEDISNCAKKAFTLKSGTKTQLKGIYCFRCERLFTAPWELLGKD